MGFLVDQQKQFVPVLGKETEGFFQLDVLSEEDLDSCPLKRKIKEYTAIYFKSAYGTVEIDFEQYTVDGASIIFLSPGQIFNAKGFDSKMGWQVSFDKEFYCIETHGKAIACNGLLFNNYTQASIVSLKDFQGLVFESLFKSLHQELEVPGVAHKEMLASTLKLILIQGLRLLDKPSSSVGQPTNRLVRDFMALVEKYFQKEHQVAHYAGLLAVSPKSLAKRLQLEKYPTPTKVIRDRIMLEAQRQLRFNDEPIKYIAFDLGFDDPAYFTRIFT